MDGLLVFDHSNDIIFTKLNGEMKRKIKDMAFRQDLVEIDAEEKTYLDANVIIQLFSPIITSQRMMFCQFDNTYTSLQCENDLSIIFEEHIGYLFLKIGVEPIEKLQRSLAVFISFVQHLCGPDVQLLKSSAQKRLMLNNVTNTWQRLYETNQGIMLEAIEPLLVNQDLRNEAIRALESGTDNLKQDPHSQRNHALLFIGNKFLSLYSSRQAQEIAPGDILFLSLLCESLKTNTIESKNCTMSHLLFLHGLPSAKPYAGCMPHITHITHFDYDATLILIIEYGSLSVASGLQDAFYSLQKAQNLQAQFDIESLRATFDDLDGRVKQTLDALKKAKLNNTLIEKSGKRLGVKWETIKRKYIEYFKFGEKELIVNVESNLPGILENLKELFKLACVECNTLEHGRQRVSEINETVRKMLIEFREFLQVKSIRNCTMGAYLEEFPGLVHFIHIDRTNGRMIAPNLEDNSSNQMFGKEKVWGMIELARSYLQQGHMAIMWKDKAFNYSYFVWFEDGNGIGLKPKKTPILSNAPVVVSSVQPGMLTGPYYQRLIENCFPKIQATKIKCFELFCIHLGLASASCVLEHCRRLSSTINEVTGAVRNPIDLL